MEAVMAVAKSIVQGNSSHAVSLTGQWLVLAVVPFPMVLMIGFLALFWLSTLPCSYLFFESEFSDFLGVP